MNENNLKKMKNVIKAQIKQQKDVKINHSGVDVQITTF